jgi:hypothetical protein
MAVTVAEFWIVSSNNYYYSSSSSSSSSAILSTNHLKHKKTSQQTKENKTAMPQNCHLLSLTFHVNTMTWKP